MQVELNFRAHLRFAVLVVFSGTLIAVLPGCHRSPAPNLVATVNGKEILRSDLDKAYQSRLGDNPQQPSPEQADIVRLELLRGMIDDEILQQRAAKLNLVASDEDVNARLTEIKAPFTQEEFDRQLKQRNTTLDDLKRDVRRQLTTTKLLNKEIESKINITDGEIGSYYNSHKADFNFIEPRYNIARIVVSNAPSAQATNLQNNKASSDADAKKKIQALHAKLENSEDFGSLAMNYSEDKDSGSNGGDMGFVTESQLHSDPEAYNAITKLKPGQFTDVLPIVDSSSHRAVGYAIYKLISREPEGQRQLSDPRVQQTIRQTLRQDHAQLFKNAYYEVLHDDAKVHNYLADQILKEGSK
ncbi:MAG: SurA N-terminal domain-containing protein [Terracidiphilus sp.]